MSPLVTELVGKVYKTSQSNLETGCLTTQHDTVNRLVF